MWGREERQQIEKTSMILFEKFNNKEKLLLARFWCLFCFFYQLARLVRNSYLHKRSEVSSQVSKKQLPA